VINVYLSYASGGVSIYFKDKLCMRLKDNFLPENTYHLRVMNELRKLR
jgi:hypothetical protein